MSPAAYVRCHTRLPPGVSLIATRLNWENVASRGVVPAAYTLPSGATAHGLEARRSVPHLLPDERPCRIELHDEEAATALAEARRPASDVDGSVRRRRDCLALFFGATAPRP